MAADPDPYFALPKLYGAPAYARPPRVVPETERPFDPDDLPIVAEQAADEPAFAGVPFSSDSYRSIGTDSLLAAASPASRTSPVEVGAASSPGADPATTSPSASAGGVGASRFSLRSLTDRLGPRSK